MCHTVTHRNTKYVYLYEYPWYYVGHKLLMYDTANKDCLRSPVAGQTYRVEKLRRMFLLDVPDNTVNEQNIDFLIDYIDPSRYTEILYKRIRRKIRAGMHVGPFLAWSGTNFRVLVSTIFREPGFVSVPVLFREEWVVFYDGQSTSVSKFAIPNLGYWNSSLREEVQEAVKMCPGTDVQRAMQFFDENVALVNEILDRQLKQTGGRHEESDQK